MIALTDLKAWLDITVDTYDDMLTALEERAVDFVERQLQWYFGPPRETTEYMDGTGTPRMFLRQPPDDGAVVLAYRSGVGADGLLTTTARLAMSGQVQGEYAVVWQASDVRVPV